MDILISPKANKPLLNLLSPQPTQTKICTKAPLSISLSTMSLSNWLCNNKASKIQFVKIVYPGGHVELHDRPVLAADIALRNPKCCVAHLHVFQKPWAIVEPETMLMLGQKFYVVPISTVRKLQRFYLKYSPINC